MRGSNTAGPADDTRHPVWRRIDGAVLALSLVLAAARFLRAHARDPVLPQAEAAHTGWWWWTDQSRYLAAALAWSRGDLSAAHHWYPPGYPLLGALFVRLTPPDPFLLPDLACLLATIVLAALLARAVAPHRPWSFALGAASVALTVLPLYWLPSHLLMELWEEPWTTTPAVPLALACVLLALRFETAPSAPLAFSAALLAVGETLFRPTDALVLLVAVAPVMAVSLLLRRRGRAALPFVAAAVAGAALAASLAVGIHLLIYGLQKGSYLQESEAVGFEWRLVPLRWITIVVSPRPLFADGRGLAQVFPWVVPGVLGLVAGAAGLLGGRRSAHRLAAWFVAVHLVAYLAYRDLHPQGLLRYHNDHYFKVVLAILAVYAPMLAVELVLSRRRLGIAAAALAAFVALFCWRAEWVPSPPGSPAPQRLADGRIVVPDDMRFPGDATLVPAAASFDSIYGTGSTLSVGARLYFMNADIKLVPVPGGLLVQPLRVLAPGPEILTLDPAIGRPLAGPVTTGRETAVFGLPCWWRKAARCGATAAVASPQPARPAG